MNKLPMTAAGHSALEDELKRRIQVERPHFVQRIQDAIAGDSNLAENSEYHAAKAEQEINEARIAELEDKLARAEIIDVSKLSGDTIKFGATVTLIEEDTGEKKVWQIVGEPEADVKKGKISVSSPIARALIGKTKGATVEVETPGGAKSTKSGRWDGPLREGLMDERQTHAALSERRGSALSAADYMAMLRDRAAPCARRMLALPVSTDWCCRRCGGHSASPTGGGDTENLHAR
jgi:transcription elongation factor GreA